MTREFQESELMEMLAEKKRVALEGYREVIGDESWIQLPLDEVATHVSSLAGIIELGNHCDSFSAEFIQQSLDIIGEHLSDLICFCNQKDAGETS